jgi:hypothetical protein
MTVNGGETAEVEAAAPPVVEPEYSDSQLADFAVRLNNDPFVQASWKKLEEIMMRRAFATDPDKVEAREKWYGVAKCVDELRKEIGRVATAASQEALRKQRLTN